MSQPSDLPLPILIDDLAWDQYVGSWIHISEASGISFNISEPQPNDYGYYDMYAAIEPVLKEGVTLEGEPPRECDVIGFYPYVFDQAGDHRVPNSPSDSKVLWKSFADIPHGKDLTAKFNVLANELLDSQDSTLHVVYPESLKGRFEFDPWERYDVRFASERDAVAASKLVVTGPHVMPHVVLQQKGDDALLKTTNDFVIASGYDQMTHTWSHGRYFGSDAVKAFAAFAHDELYKDYVPAIKASDVLDREPRLTEDEAEGIAECANENIINSDALSDVVYDQIGAEIENAVENFAPDRAVAFNLQRRLINGDTIYNPVTGTYVDSNLDGQYPDYYKGTVTLEAAGRFIGENLGLSDSCFYDIAQSRATDGVSVDFFTVSADERRSAAHELAFELSKEPGEFIYPLMGGRNLTDPVLTVAKSLERSGHPDLSRKFLDVVNAHAAFLPDEVRVAIAKRRAADTVASDGPAHRGPRQ